MFRSFAAAALALAAAAPAIAQGASAVAVPVAQPAKPAALVAGETLWSFNKAGYTASALTSRPAIACQQVVKKVGALSSFSVNGTALSADELAKCNAKAKGGATALAAK